MGAMDHTLKQTVPYYSTMKRAGAFRQPQKPQKRQKRTTLTEYSQNGQKAILKPHVTVNQAARNCMTMNKPDCHHMRLQTLLSRCRT